MYWHSHSITLTHAPETCCTKYITKRQQQQNQEKKYYVLNIHWLIQLLYSLLTYDDDFGFLFFHNRLSRRLPFLFSLLALNENVYRCGEVQAIFREHIKPTHTWHKQKKKKKKKDERYLLCLTRSIRSMKLCAPHYSGWNFLKLRWRRSTYARWAQMQAAYRSHRLSNCVHAKQWDDDRERASWVFHHELHVHKSTYVSLFSESHKEHLR